MTNKSDVVIDFNAPSITWGNPLDEKCLSLSIEARNLKIPINLYGEAATNKTKIMAGLRRSLKFFIRAGKLCDAIDFNSHVKLFLVTHTPGNIDVWGREAFNDAASLGKYGYGVCLNLEEPSEMVVYDTHNVTSLISDDLDVVMRNKPACIEFVKSEGGVLFMPHLLGLDALSHQAVVAQRIRRDMWRRTRPGAHFTDYGILELRQVDNLVELWLGVAKVWSVDLAHPYDIIPDADYFASWGIEYILEDRSARKRMAEFTVVNFNR